MAKLGSVAVGIVLARLLGPREFGTFAVASVALTIMTNVNDLGVSLAIVRWPGDPRDIAPTVTTISVITSAVLYVGCYFGAPGYSAAMGAPAATEVVRVLSLVILIDGFATAPIGLLQRNFRADHRTVADQVNVWLGMLLTLALALGGLGAMSLAIGRVVGCLAAVGLLVHLSPEPLRFGFNRREARALLRFGLPLAGTGVIAFAIANVDQLVVGRMLGVTALGFFVLAANLSSWPSAAFSEPISQVAPAALARLQHDPSAMRTSFETMLALVSAVTVPVCLVESGSAAPLIRIVYGIHWLPAHQPLIWLALLAALQIFFQLTLDYFAVLGRSRMLIALQTAWLVVLVPSLIAGARMQGVAGVAFAELAVAVALPLPWYLVSLHRAGLRGRSLAIRLGLPLLGAAAAGAAAAGAAAVAPSAWLALPCGALAGLLVISLLLLRMRSVLATLRRRFRGASPGEAEGLVAASSS
jgi:O-antigen/teichoic acid export membrane protein